MEERLRTLLREQRPVTVAAGCAAPFAAAAVCWRATPTSISGPGLWPCPFRAITGLPCPICGATRSVVLFTHGNTRFLNYNPVWVVVLLAAVFAGLVGWARQLSGRGACPKRLATAVRRAGPLRLCVALLALGWCCSLAHAKAITGHST